MRPFQNEEEELEIADLKIENRLDRVTIYGRIDLSRDKAGLANARLLRQLFEDVVNSLEKDGSLPERAAPPKAPVIKPNPFV